MCWGYLVRGTFLNKFHFIALNLLPLKKYPRWKVDLTNYDLDVYFHVNDMQFTLGLTVQVISINPHLNQSSFFRFYIFRGNGYLNEHIMKSQD